MLANIKNCVKSLNVSSQAWLQSTKLESSENGLGISGVMMFIKHYLMTLTIYFLKNKCKKTKEAKIKQNLKTKKKKGKKMILWVEKGPHIHC